jgi:simple sugar transport system substrate-binding protein
MRPESQHRRKRTSYLLITILVLLVIFGDGYYVKQQSQLQQQPVSQPTPIAGKRVVMIIHSNLQISSFWPVVIRGAQQGANDTHLILEYHDLEKIGDYEQMTRLIEEAIASKPDGIVISFPDAKALTPAVMKIADAKIPFIIVNAGAENAQKLGALTYVGQLEYDAGFSAGMRMAQAGVHRAFCINLTPNATNTKQRCQGFTDAIQATGGTVEVLVADKKDLDQAKERIKMALELAPDTNGLLATADLPVMLDAIKEAGMQGKVQFASFDFSPVSLEAIQNGDMLFAVDQQPYLQGYLPMVILDLYFENANTMRQNIATGPDFITLENVARIKTLAEEGTR